MFRPRKLPIKLFKLRFPVRAKQNYCSTIKPEDPSTPANKEETKQPEEEVRDLDKLFEQLIQTEVDKTVHKIIEKNKANEEDDETPDSLRQMRLETTTDEELRQRVDETLVDHGVSLLKGPLDGSCNWIDESFLTNLFRGNLALTQIFPFPEVLDDEQVADLRKFLTPAYECFVKDPNARVRHDVEATFLPEDMEAYKKLGLLKVNVPKKYGGYGFNYTQQTRMMQMLGEHDLSIATLITHHQFLGLKALKHFGNTEQHETYFKKIIDGAIFSFALHEVKAESDIASIQCKAKKTSDGNSYLINGTKNNVANASLADVFTVFALTENDESGDLEITCFLVEKKFGGIEVGNHVEQMGMRAAQTSSVTFKNCKVPNKNVIGNPGDGFRIANRCLNQSRFSIGSVVTGVMREVVSKTVEFASNRVQFGRKIYTFNAIQSKLIEMAMNQYVTESIAYLVAGHMDRGFHDCTVEAVISKTFSSKMAWYVLDLAMQVFGAKGYLRQYGIEQILRDVRYYRFVGGTDDILRLFIALTGIQHAGIDNSELQEAYKNPITHLNLIFGTPQKPKPQISDITPSIAHLVHPALINKSRLVINNVNKFGIIVDLLLESHGKDLVAQQFYLLELADCAIAIYGMLCALSRCTKSLYGGTISASFELAITKRFCLQTSARVQKVLDMLETRANIASTKHLVTLTADLIAAKGCVDEGVLGF